VELRLEAGEVAVFNQRKILHGPLFISFGVLHFFFSSFVCSFLLLFAHFILFAGRGAFRSDPAGSASAARGGKAIADADVDAGGGDGGVRHFQGCYVNIDDFLNRYRVLKRRMDDDASTELEQPGRGGDVCADVHIGNSSL
jgi:hypothetical protein